MVDNMCGQGEKTVNSTNISSKICSGWYALPFSLGSFEMYFSCSNQLVFVNPKTCSVFSGIDRARRGLVELKYTCF